MTQELEGWTYNNVKAFLQEKGFHFFKELEGLHEAWIRFGEKGGLERIVEVTFSTTAYSSETLKRMIHQSGVDEDEWITWGVS